MKLPILDLIVFIALTCGNIFFGSGFFYKKKISRQFASGGGKLPARIVGMSILITLISSISFLAFPLKAYISGWNAFIFSLFIPLASIFVLKLLIRLYGDPGPISAYNYFDISFVTRAGIYASVCDLPTPLMRTGAIRLLLTLPLNTLIKFKNQKIIV